MKARVFFRVGARILALVFVSVATLTELFADRREKRPQRCRLLGSQGAVQRSKRVDEQATRKAIQRHMLDESGVCVGKTLSGWRSPVQRYRERFLPTSRPR